MYSVTSWNLFIFLYSVAQLTFTALPFYLVKKRPPSSTNCVQVGFCTVKSYAYLGLLIYELLIYEQLLSFWYHRTLTFCKCNYLDSISTGAELRGGLLIYFLSFCMMEYHGLHESLLLLPDEARICQLRISCTLGTENCCFILRLKTRHFVVFLWIQDGTFYQNQRESFNKPEVWTMGH